MNKTVRYPSEKQYRFVADLLATRDWSSLSDKYRARLDELSVLVPEFVVGVDTGKWTDFDTAAPHGPIVFDQARALIETVMPLPRNGKPSDNKSSVRAEDFPNVFAGRYAVDTADGHLAFYKVSVPNETSYYHGRVFVDVMASDESYPVRGLAARTVLEKIAVDPIEAAKNYGQEIGSCGKCGKTLTDELSRAFGIGPKCRIKLGL